MAKKLLAVSFLMTVLIFSSISIYAANQEDTIEAIERQTGKAVPVMAETAAASETYAKKVVKERKLREKREKEQKYLTGLSAYIRHINRNVPAEEALAMAESFVRYGKKYGVDEKVVMAVAQNESTYYSDAVSSENFKGLMQTGDGLARNAGYDPGRLFDPEISIKVGARYLSIKLDEFGDLRLALTAYNQGSGSVHSGNYTTGYADLALQRAEAVDSFLTANGYQ